VGDTTRPGQYTQRTLARRNRDNPRVTTQTLYWLIALLVLAWILWCALHEEIDPVAWVERYGY